MKLRICLIIVFIKCIFPVTSKGVKFRDFILADIMTSHAIAFANLTVAMCLIYCQECRKSDSIYECHKNQAIPAALCFPVLIRIIQYFLINLKIIMTL